MFKAGYIMRPIISIVVTIIVLANTYVFAQEYAPDIETLSEIVCPDDKPYKCVPEGQCCSSDQYCSSKSKSCESCFPNMKEDSDILQYCLSTRHRELKGQCQFACRHRFGREMDAALMQNAAKQVTEVNETEAGNDQGCPILQTDCITYILIGLFSTIGIISVVVLLACRRRCFRCCYQEKCKNKLQSDEVCPLTTVKVDAVPDSSDSIGIHRRNTAAVSQAGSPDGDLDVNQSTVELQTLLGKSTSGRGTDSPDSGLGSNHSNINQQVTEREQSDQRAMHINETTGGAAQAEMVTSVSRHPITETEEVRVC